MASRAGQATIESPSLLFITDFNTALLVERSLTAAISYISSPLVMLECWKNLSELTNQRVYQILVYRNDLLLGFPTGVLSLPLATLFFIFSHAVFCTTPWLTERLEEAIVLLDLSATFGTVDHQILFTRRKCRYGVKGNALAWMRSYLSNRFQYVRVANDCSSKHKLACGVPQGSVLGPILYSIYTAPIADVIKRHGMGYHFYVDDTQIYMSFNPSDVLQSKSLIEECIQDVQLWVVANKLKLDWDKTELLVLTARQRPRKCALYGWTNK